MDALTSAALNSVATVATTNQNVLQDRARAAAVVDLGYTGLDIYDSWQPVLFWGSVAGLIASSYAGTKRRKVPEAVTLYAITGISSALVAWITRPAFLRPTPTPAQAAAQATASTPALGAAVGWLDARVAKNDAARPGWERATWSRMAQDVGTTDPAVITILTRNAH